MSVIGLRVYQVRIYKDHNVCVLKNDKGHLDALNSFKSFSLMYGKGAYNNGNSKTFRVVPEISGTNTEHGILKYGTYGFGADVEEVATGDIKYQRSVNEAETIPIYYRFWAAPGKKYALLGIQSYGNRSCVDMFRLAFRDYYRANNADYNMEIQKLMPNERKIYGKQTVKRISLVKRNEPTSSLKPRLKPDNTTIVDLELSITPKLKGNFGKLRDIDDRLGGTIAIDDIEYEGAFATIRVGTTSKRIGVLGLSSSAGVIDVTSDISLDSDNHPEITSIARVFESHMKDFASDLG